MNFLRNHISILGWLIGFGFNFGYAFLYRNTGVFQNTLGIGVGSSLANAIMAFVLVRPVSFFRGGDFLNRWFPWVFVALSVIIEFL